jgi:hypothetical protein
MFMSRSLDDLKPEMKAKALNVKKYCELRGVDLLIYYTTRTLQEQAILFRQSFNDYSVVKRKMAKLESMGYDFLAKILKDVGSQPYMGWKTNAACGESFHNYGFAIDAVPCEGKECLWSYEDNERQWDVYMDACENEGLFCGGRWVKKDYPHAQFYEASNPLDIFTIAEVKQMLNIK